MLELFQFQHSPFCLKVRLALEAKKISYRTIEISPGIEQIKVFRVSGQKQVPVLRHDQKIFSESNVILQYLETFKKEPKLIPEDPRDAATAYLLESWADTTLAKATRLEILKAAIRDPSLLENLFPGDYPKPFNKLLNKLPNQLFNGINSILKQSGGNSLLTNLEQLSHSICCKDWLVGNSLTIADIAIASQLSLLKFPASSGENLCGKGCPGFADNPSLQPLFQWRDQLEELIFEVDPASI